MKTDLKAKEIYWHANKLSKPDFGRIDDIKEKYQDSLSPVHLYLISKGRGIDSNYPSLDGLRHAFNLYTPRQFLAVSLGLTDDTNTVDVSHLDPTYIEEETFLKWAYCQGENHSPIQEYLKRI